MRVLITGAAGFIGSHLADRLVALGNDVEGVDDLTTGRESNRGNWRLRLGDICDRTDFYRIANRVRPELVIHCAASYSDPDLWHRDIDTNIAGAVNVAAVCRHHQARCVYFQTVLPPTSSYAISKIAAEQYLRLGGFPLMVVRLANIYGPRNLSGPIPTFTRKLLAGETCTIAHTQRDFVYIETLIDAVIESLRPPWGVGAEMVVHSGRQTHIRTVYELVSAELRVSAQHIDAPAADDDVPVIDWNGAAPVPDCSLSFGIRETVAWYREHGVGDTYTHLRVGTG